MKANYRKAYNELKAISAPVIDGGYDGEDTFRISGEDNYPETWADYYREYPAGLDDFGVNLKINTILEKHDLFAEWINPGVLGVCEN